jgi:hypothetical protein
LYVADFSQNNFYVYTIDPATGLITLSQTINLNSFGAEVRPNGVEVSDDGNYVYVSLYDVNQVLETTVVMYSRSLTAPFTLTQSNVYTISGAVGEQTGNLILTKQQNLLIMSVAGSTGAPIHSWTRNTLNGRLTLNADVTGFGAGIATNTGTISIPIDLIVNGTFTSPGFTSPFTQMPPGWFILGSNWDATSGYLQLNGGNNATSSAVDVVPGATYTYSVTVLPGFGSFFDNGNKISILHSTRVGGGGVLSATQIPIPSAGTYTGTWVAPLNATTVAVGLSTFSYTSFRADNVVFYKNT